MKKKGFWEAVIKYFEKETGSTRGYDSILSKWKNKVRPRIGSFCTIVNNIEANHESGSNDLDVYQKTCAEYKMIYRHDFTLEHCYNILKDHQADESEKETQEKRAMGRDRAKAKKKSSASSREGSSSFVDLVADKFLNMKKEKWEKREVQQQPNIQLKNRELDIREAERREAVELKRGKLAIQRRTLELAEREKRDRDILFYNSEISSLCPQYNDRSCRR
ncbi:hypothetical protein Tco_0053710 [Tanacetum coccineum]